VAPATPGSTPAHDLGDGMYLADSQDVAQRYAAMRSPDPAGQRVYTVSVPTGGLKVLDLTTDPRWKQYMGPIAPGLPSNESLIKRANENYGKFFESFCKTHKINLADYDAVVGPEYVRGGKQMVILFKGGKPSVLQGRVRGNFKVVMVAGATPTRTPPGALTFKGKIGPGLRTAGVAVGTTAAFLALAYIDNKLREKFAEGEMKKLEPKIAARIYSMTKEVAEIQVNGGKPFANITVSATTVYNNFGYFTPAQEPGASYPIIELADVSISTRNLNSTSHGHTNGLIAPTDTDTQVYSIPLELSKPEIELYRAFVLELQWYDEAARGAAAGEDLLRLTRDRDELMKRFDQVFARP